MNGDWSAFERFERLLEPALDGFTRGLTLPADEPRPVVGSGQVERTWRGGRAACARRSPQPPSSHARAGFGDRRACGAQRADGRIVVGSATDECMEWHVETLLAAAAVDDGGSRHYLSSGRTGHVNRFAHRATGRDDVFHDQHLLTRVRLNPRRNVSVPS